MRPERPTSALSNMVFMIQAGAMPQFVVIIFSTQAVVFSKIL